MYIDELKPGETVLLELVKGKASYEVGTVVLGNKLVAGFERHVLLKPFEYQGKVLDLSGKSFSGVQFNLYASNSEGKRVIWKQISLEVKTYKNESYYIITPHKHNLMGVVCERRFNDRYKVNIEGVMECPASHVEKEVIIYDISAVGISFIHPESLNVVDHNIIIHFEEVINDKIYSLDVEAFCLRVQNKDDEYLYGCSVKQASNQMLAYVYIKKLISNHVFEIKNQ